MIKHSLKMLSSTKLPQMFRNCQLVHISGQVRLCITSQTYLLLESTIQRLNDSTIDICYPDYVDEKKQITIKSLIWGFINSLYYFICINQMNVFRSTPNSISLVCFIIPKLSLSM